MGCEAKGEPRGGKRKRPERKGDKPEKRLPVASCRERPKCTGPFPKIDPAKTPCAPGLPLGEKSTLADPEAIVLWGYPLA